MDRAELERKWDRATGVPLLVLSVVFLVIYAWPIIDPNLSGQVVGTFEVLQTVIWGLFVLDFVGRFLIAPRKWPFLKRNVIELLAVLLPMLRPLRALRLLSVVTIGLRRFGSKLRNRVTIYVFATAFMLWFLAGLAVTEAERGATEANIETVAQGWWWAFITLATVGYGDKFPVTSEGQWVAVGIVLTGIALLGTVSAVLAAWFVDALKDSKSELVSEAAETNAKLEDVLVEIRELKKENAEIKTLLDEQATKGKFEQPSSNEGNSS